MTRTEGAENVISIMNGNFVQRGEPALCDKLVRARTAVENGADLVIELPLKYGISSANHFASGAVLTAAATGLDGTFSFGASAEKEKLAALADILTDLQTAALIGEISKKEGKSYPSAAQSYIGTFLPEFSDICEDANNVLGIEYIKAIKENGAAFDFFCVDRSKTAFHDALAPINEYASAQYIRDAVRNGKTDAVKNYMPQSSFELMNSLLSDGKCTENKRFFSDVCLARLSDRKADYFTQINGVSQGLENRIAECVKESACLESLQDSVKTKRFTHARIRQIILAAVLGVTRNDLVSGVNYIRVLAFNDKGRELLKQMRNTAKVPVITNLSDINDSSSLQAQRDKSLDILAGKLYELCRTKPENGNTEILIKPYKV